MPLSDQDRDLVTRTVLAEAGPNASPSEQAAVAAVVMNRLKQGSSGGYADTVPGVLYQRNAFEAWGLPRNAPNNPWRFDPGTPAYQAASHLVDGVESGAIPDPTNGADHFLQPDIVAGRVRAGTMTWPKWAVGKGQKIGTQVFYGGGKKAAPDNGADADAFFTRTTAAPAQAPMAADTVDPQEFFNRTTQGASPAPAPVAQPGATVPTPPQVGTGATYETPQEATASLQRGAEAEAERNKPIMQRAIEATPGYGMDVLHAVGSELGQAESGAAQSVPDIMAGKPASAAADIAGGLMGLVGAPFTAISKPVSDAVTQATGNPEAGQRAGIVASLLTPVPGASEGAAAKVGTAIHEARPSVQGIQQLISSIPQDELADTIARLERNPNLSLADVSPQVRNIVQGLAVQTGEPWQSFLSQVAKQRGRDAYAAVSNATNELGVSDSAYNVLQGIMQKAKDTGQKVIQPILQKADPIPTQQVLDALDAKIGKVQGQPTVSQSQLLRLRDQVAGAGDTISASGLHGIQSRLREDASTLTNSATGSDRLAGKDLMGARGSLVDIIDEHAPGYKDGLSAYRDDMQIREAFNRGLGVATTQKGEAGILEDSPQAWQAWAKNASPDEMDAARAGALADIQRRIAQSARPVSEETRGAPIPQINQNERARFDVLFGPDKTNQFIAQLRDESNRAALNQVLFGGSQTAARQAAQEVVAPPIAKKAGPPSLSTALFGMAAGHALPLLSGGTVPEGLGELIGIPAMIAAQHVVGPTVRKGMNAIEMARWRMRNQTMAKAAVAEGGEREPLLDLLRSRRDAAAQPNKIFDLILRRAQPYIAALPR